MFAPSFATARRRPATAHRVHRRSLAPAAAATLAALLAVAPPRAARAQAEPPPAGPVAVSGAVHGPGGISIVGAEVTVMPRLAPTAVGVQHRTYTDDAGRFRIPAVAAGRASVVVRRIGYRLATQDVVLDGRPLALEVEAVPQQLSAVVVQSRRRVYDGPLADWNRRRDFGMGRFITREEIDRRNPLRTSDLLRTIPGIMVQNSRGQSVVRIRGNRCDPLVFIDGMPAYAGYFDIDALVPSTLEGIEVYAGLGTVPVELRGSRGEHTCGVLALWSRMPEPRRRTKKKPVTAEDLAALVASATLYTADQVDVPAKVDPENPVEPVYPDSLKRAHVPGEAIVEFVVDTAGVVETETVGVVASSDPKFGEAVRYAVPAARFTPALKAGRRVRQLVQLPVRFELGNQVSKDD